MACVTAGEDALPEVRSVFMEEETVKGRGRVGGRKSRVAWRVLLLDLAFIMLTPVIHQHIVILVDNKGKRE